MYFPHKALNSTSVLDLGAILYSEITHAIIQNTENEGFYIGKDSDAGRDLGA